MFKKNKGSTFFYVIMLLTLTGIIITTMSNLVLFDMKAAKQQRKNLQDYYTLSTICESLSQATIKNENDLVKAFCEKLTEIENENEDMKTPPETPPPEGTAPPKPDFIVPNEADFKATGESKIENGEKLIVETVLDVSGYTAEEGEAPAVKVLTITVTYKKQKITVRLNSDSDFKTSNIQWKEVAYYEEEI